MPGDGVSGSRKTVKQKKKKSMDNFDFPIVGIGASAGGLEALEQFFGNMPGDSGMAFVVIQHLDPTHAGIMPELLQRITSMSVFQASDQLPVQPNCVYVIPPNKSLTLLNGNLLLFDPVESRGLRLPVDTFFRSLADDRLEKSIGIILSGMGSDGCLGLRAIKEKNGTVLVQEPGTAKFDGMPRSAIQTVVVDIVAPANELPLRLINYLKFIPTVPPDPEIDDKSKSDLDKIIFLLREQTGHDFSLYKKNTLLRRIERRKGIHQFDKLQSYVRYCMENSGEITLLFKELLIGVTSFFRDPAAWERLSEKVLPELIENIPDRTVLRVWVTACSTGEEAYSLAIALVEVLEKFGSGKNLSFQIFATDIDLDAIDQARKALFSANIAADVSPERLNRFFSPTADGYRVNASIRQMLIFAPHNIIKDPPFTRLDLLTCRNMLIYLEPALQKKLIALFNYTLNPAGILVLGTAETINNQTDNFEEVDGRLKIFRRNISRRISDFIDFPSSFNYKRTAPTEMNTLPKLIENVQTLADQLLLQRFSPCSVLVNEKGDILYMTGPIGKYLQPVAGKANWNIYVMARDGLRLELPGALRKAIQGTEEVVLRNMKIGTNGGTLRADVTINQIVSENSLNGMVILIFNEITNSVEDLTPKKGVRSSTGRMKELEIQLQRSLENLQGTQEEMQTSQEELKSTNEELQSTNEELQSTNEELTTSKEEMQSLNEELITVNLELQSKVSDFLQTNDDMKNLLNSTEIATLFLDKDLNIRRFTDQATNIFKLRKIDIGRPFTDQASDLKYPEIDKHAKQVLKTLVSMETPTQNAVGKWYNVRIMPYRTLDDRIDGLVITFTDITQSKQAEFALAVSETRFRKLFESAKEGILILDFETGKITDVNPWLMELLGFSKSQFIEKSIWEIGLFKDIVANKEKFKELQDKEMIRYENLPLETAGKLKINVEFISNVFSVGTVKHIQCLVRETR